MIRKDDTHEFASMSCRHLGSPCPEALRLARQLTRAVALAAPFTEPNLEFAGVCRLQGCARNCEAVFVASKLAVRIYGDVDADAGVGVLAPSDLASTSTTGSKRSASVAVHPATRHPSLLVQAVPRNPMASAQRSAHRCTPARFGARKRSTA